MQINAKQEITHAANCEIFSCSYSLFNFTKIRYRATFSYKFHQYKIFILFRQSPLHSLLAERGISEGVCQYVRFVPVFSWCVLNI